METKLCDTPAEPRAETKVEEAVGAKTSVLWRTRPPDASGDYEIIEVHPVAIVCLCAALVGMLMTLVFVVWLFWPTVFGVRAQRHTLVRERTVIPVAAPSAPSGERKPSSMGTRAPAKQISR